MVAKAVGASAEPNKAKAAEEKVHGPQMEKVETDAPSEPEPNAVPWVAYSAGALLLLLLIGFRKRVGGLS